VLYDFFYIGCDIAGCGCFEVVVDAEGFAATTSRMLWGSSVSDVINFRLEQVITPKRASAQK